MVVNQTEFTVSLPTKNVVGSAVKVFDPTSQSTAEAFIQIAADTGAEPDPATITVASVTGKPGESIQVPVTLANSPEFSSLSAHITYDSSVLEMTAIASGLPTFVAPAGDPLANGYVGCASADDFTWNDTLCTATFTIKADAAYGTYPVGFSVDYMMTGDEKTDYTPDIVPGAVTVVPAGSDALQDGYSVFMDNDKVVNAGEAVSIAVGIAGQGTGFEKYTNDTMAFTYDASLLRFDSVTGLNTGDELGNDQVSAEAANGVITVRKYGTEQISSVSGTAFTLHFTALAAGVTEVTCTDAGIGNNVTADAQNEIRANQLDKVTIVTINAVATAEYDVEISSGEFEDVEITGSDKAIAGQDYTFTVDDPNFDYTFTATVNDEPVTVTPGENGAYTIAATDVTGNIRIVLIAMTPKSWTVTVKDGEGQTVQPADVDVTLPEGAPTYKQDYVFSVAETTGFTYVVAVTVGGEAVTPSVADGTYTIAGAAITGDVVITVTKAEIVGVAVEFMGTGAEEVVGGAAQSAAVGEDFSFTVEGDTYHYDYTASAVRGTQYVNVIDEGNGVFTIPASYITAGETPITVTVNKTRDLHLVVKGSEYVKMDGTSAILIRATAELFDGEVLVRDLLTGPVSNSAQPMYYSTDAKYTADFDGDVDGVWVILVFTSGNYINSAVESVRNLIKATAGSVDSMTLDYDYNVNLSSATDTNDAQLVWKMYNAQYTSGQLGNDTVLMKKFLLADTNQDKVLNVLDSGAIINYLING